jgi:hypothetical protein
VTGEDTEDSEVGGLLVAEYFNDVRIIASFFTKKD